MAHTLILMVALATVIGTAKFASEPASAAQGKASLTAYCTKSRALMGQAYFAPHEKTCRRTRRLLA